MIGDQLLTSEVGMEAGKAYMRNTDTFAWRLRQQRDAMGITQFEMCDRIIAIIRRDEPEFSLSYPAYNKYETGDTATPRLNVLTAIREITGLSLDYLIAGEPEETGSEFATEEAEQIAVIVDSLPPDLRAALLDGATLLQRLDRTIAQNQRENQKGVWLDCGALPGKLPSQSLACSSSSVLSPVHRSAQKRL